MSQRRLCVWNSCGNYLLADSMAGSTPNILPLSTDCRGWKLWLERYASSHLYVRAGIHCEATRDGTKGLAHLADPARLLRCSADKFIAAGFSYFESLILRRNKSQLEDEIARLISYNNLISNAGGIELWLVEDMTDETINLLRELSVVVEESVEDAMSLLMDQFNHPVTSPNIIYHLRLLASVWLAANPDEYSGFIPDGLGVTGYRKNCLEVVNTEIEHLGMTLLIDALLKPIGITVEIVMLDRSEGSQANSHIFQSEDSRVMPTDAGGPMIHLLYRPSHYDILYKDVPATSPHDIKSEMSQYSNIQVNRAHSLPVQQHLNSAGDLGQFSSIDIDSSPFLDLPGFSMSHPHKYTPQYHSLDNSYTHSPMSSSMSPVLPSSTQVSSTTSNMTSPYQPQQPPAASRQAHNLQAHYGAPTQVPMHASQMSPTAQHPHNFNPSSLAHRPAVPSNLSSPIKQEISAPVATPNSFRPSHYQYQASANERHEPVICQTTTFKNSHFNTAHYLNPDFQPEEWTPENEERRGSS